MTFREALACVEREVRPLAVRERVSLRNAHGRVLAQDVLADRDYPPFHRSMRDGFAVRAADLPGAPHVIGEVRAGQRFEGVVGRGEAVSIMTGAPVPEGADAVVMVEHGFSVSLAPGANIAPHGSEAAAGSVVLRKGDRVDYTGIAWLAATGATEVDVFRRPSVSILATGDEIVEVTEQPQSHQIRNSNAWSLAAQVERAGGSATILPVAPDRLEDTRALIEQGLEHDLLLLSGGVSAGAYDVVEPAIAELAAAFFFTRVRIQPGQPLVFGTAQGKPFFGLPGNPASTMVTFEVFARIALRILAGEREPTLPISLARLTAAFRHKTGLTRFLPARVRNGEVTYIPWQGSGDIPSLTRANAWLIADAERAEYAPGDIIAVLAK